MGQIVSKKLIPKNLSKAIDSFESKMTKDAMDDIARKKSYARAVGAKYSDPNASDGGFKRDSWGEGKGEGMAQESRQRDFLNDEGGTGGRGKVGSGNETPKEMPQDLLNFINAAGPLERKVNKSMTSPKVYDSLLEGEEEERRMQTKANQRTRRRMLMVENEQERQQQQHQQPQNEGGGEILRGGADELDLHSEQMTEAQTTTRTTNFSTGVAKEVDTSELRLTDHELFQLLRRREEVDPEEYLREKYTVGTATDGGDGETPNGPALTEEEMQKNLAYLRDLLEYNAVPVLLQDTDDDLIGAWDRDLEDLERQKIRRVTNGARLAIQNEIEDGLLADDNGGGDVRRIE